MRNGTESRENQAQMNADKRRQWPNAFAFGGRQDARQRKSRLHLCSSAFIGV
jgi:hypothetical protein